MQQVGLEEFSSSDDDDDEDEDEDEDDDDDDDDNSLKTLYIDDFFPFDPCQLPLTARFLNGLYTEWDDDEEEHEDEGNEEEDNDDVRLANMGLDDVVIEEDEEDILVLGGVDSYF